MHKTAIVSGITGFIGQHLYAELKVRGYRVIGLVEDTPANKGKSYDFEPRFVDLSRPETLQGCCKEGCIVFHLAAIAREQCNYAVDDYMTINFKGTQALLEEAAAQGVSRFIFVSTIEAAGPAQGGRPLTEEDTPHPENDYGRSKLLAEQEVLRHRSAIMSSTVVRLPMIYGPGNYLNVPKLFRAVQRPFFPMLGSGESYMEFCFVGNAVAGLILCAENERAAGEMFFISEGSRKLKEVVLAVACAVGVSTKIICIPVPLAYVIALIFETLATLLPFKPFRSPITHKPYISRKTVFWTTRSVNICSTGKAEKLLGYNPSHTLEMGLAKTVRDFRERGWIK